MYSHSAMTPLSRSLHRPASAGWIQIQRAEADLPAGKDALCNPRVFNLYHFPLAPSD